MIIISPKSSTKPYCKVDKRRRRSELVFDEPLENTFTDAKLIYLPGSGDKSMKLQLDISWELVDEDGPKSSYFPENFDFLHKVDVSLPTMINQKGLPMDALKTCTVTLFGQDLMKTIFNKNFDQNWANKDTLDQTTWYVSKLGEAFYGFGQNFHLYEQYCSKESLKRN